MTISPEYIITDGNPHFTYHQSGQAHFAGVTREVSRPTDLQIKTYSIGCLVGDLCTVYVNDATFFDPAAPKWLQNGAKNSVLTLRTEFDSSRTFRFVMQVVPDFPRRPNPVGTNMVAVTPPNKLETPWKDRTLVIMAADQEPLLVPGNGLNMLTGGYSRGKDGRTDPDRMDFLAISYERRQPA